MGKNDRKIARMAVERELNVNGWSNINLNYKKELPSRLSGCTPEAVYEWYRYHHIEHDLMALRRKTPSEERNRNVRFLEREMEAIEEWGDYSREVPTCGEMAVDRDYPCRIPSKGGKSRVVKGESNADNYFIKNENFWKVRFDGSPEVSIKDLKGIKLIAWYLDHPGTEKKRGDLYLQLHHGSVNPVSDGQAEVEKKSDGGMTGVLTVKSGADESVPALNQEAWQRLEENTKQTARYIDELIRSGREEEAKEEEGRFERLKEEVLKTYNGVVDDDGRISRGRCYDKGTYKKYDDSAAAAIRRAVGKFGKAPALKRLDNHLEKYLVKNKHVYIPPNNFPRWDIRY